MSRLNDLLQQAGGIGRKGLPRHGLHLERRAVVGQRRRDGNGGIREVHLDDEHLCRVTFVRDVCNFGGFHTVGNGPGAVIDHMADQPRARDEFLGNSRCGGCIVVRIIVIRSIVARPKSCGQCKKAKQQSDFQEYFIVGFHNGLF